LSFVLKVYLFKGEGWQQAPGLYQLLPGWSGLSLWQYTQGKILFVFGVTGDDLFLHTVKKSCMLIFWEILICNSICTSIFGKLITHRLPKPHTKNIFRQSEIPKLYNPSKNADWGL
jgi:hypothetical protein